MLGRAMIRCRWALPLTLALAGCGDDGFGPTTENVSGDYSATILTVQDNAGTTDMLGIGSAMEVTLHPDGTVSGHLFVPSLGEGGGDVDEDLVGTWSLSGDKVTIASPQDVFLTDIEFTATEGRLDGEFVGNGLLVTVRFEKPAPA
jgi:hypothetical protein